VTPISRFWHWPAILLHDSGLAASPPVRYILRVEGEGISFPVIVRCERTTSSRSSGGPQVLHPLPRFMAVPTLTTARLQLRVWRDTDLEPFAALNADVRVMEHYPQLLSPAESDAFAKHAWTRLVERGFGLWAVEVLGAAPFIGYVGLSEPSFQAPFTPCIEIGWRLAYEYWGHGYATEAAAAALRYGFGALALAEVVSFTSVGNQRSRRVMERIGMHRRPSEDFDHPNLPEGHPLRRHVLYRLPKSTWVTRLQS
jgi:RimJ/RimL family protein N-acetyltransferase